MPYSFYAIVKCDTKKEADKVEADFYDWLQKYESAVVVTSLVEKQ